MVHDETRWPWLVVGACLLGACGGDIVNSARASTVAGTAVTDSDLEKGGVLACSGVNMNNASGVVTTVLFLTNQNDSGTISIDRIAIYSGDGILRCDLSTPAVVGPHQTYPLFALHASLPCLPTPVPQPGLEALQNVVVYWSHQAPPSPGEGFWRNPLDGYTVSNASTPSALPAGRSTRDCKPIKVRPAMGR